MSCTYDPGSGEAITSDKDRVRLLLRDTDTSSCLFRDEEIFAFLEMESNLYRAAALAARSLSAQNAGKMDIRVGNKSVSGGAVATRYAALADQLEAMATKYGAAYPVFTGFDGSDRASFESTAPWGEVGDATIADVWDEEL